MNRLRIFMAAVAVVLVYAPVALADAPVFYSPASIAPTNPIVGTKLFGSNGSPICSPTCDPNAPGGQPQSYMTILPSTSSPPVGVFYTFSRCNTTCLIVQDKSTSTYTYVVQPADAGSFIRLTVTATNLDCAETRTTDNYTECRYTSAYSFADTQYVPIPIAISPAVLPDAFDGAAYNQTLTASGGTGPYSFTLASGTLPPGLALSAGGLLSGTPTKPGSYIFTVGASGAGASPSTKTYTLKVQLGVTQTLPAATAGTPYSQKLAADSAGTAPFTYAVTSGTLPPGLALSGDMVVGTPTKAGSYSFTVSVTDAGKLTGTGTITIVVNWPTLAVRPTTLAKAVERVPYHAALSTTGGVAPYAYTLVDGILPPGLSLRGNGAIVGTPRGPAGDFTFTIGVQDANGAPATVTYVIHYLAPDIVVAPAKLPAGVVGQKFEKRLAPSGGHAPYTFEVIRGKLPTGVALSERGLLIGTPTTAGRYHFTIRVTDKDGAFTTRFFTFVIKSA